MHKNELEKYLRQINKDLYRFSYCLLPDSLQVSQVIIDSITVLLLERRELVETLEFCSNELEKRDTLFSIKLFLHKKIFELIKKRTTQLTGSIEITPEFSEYYGLELIEKAVLYFKTKSDFEFEDIAFIISENRTAIFQALANGRNNLATRAGLTTLESSQEAL